MPFMPVTKRMAKMRAERKKTLQGYEVKSLGAQYERNQKAARTEFEAEQRGLLSQYQARMADYTTQLGQYEQSLRDYDQRAGQYQERANEYNRQVELYNTYNRLPGKFELRDTVLRAYGNQAIASPEYSALSNVRSAIFRDDGQGEGLWQLPSYALPAGYKMEYANERKGKYGVYYISKRAGPDPGEFTEAFPEASGIQAPTAPEAVDLSGITEKYTESLGRERDVYEREIGERKLAAQRARRRVSDRPMLSGERV